MKRASKDEVRAAAEALLSPLVEELRAEVVSVKHQLTGYRDAYSDAWSNLEALAKKFQQEQARLGQERKQVQADWKVLSAEVNTRLDGMEERHEAFTREMKGLVQGSTQNTQKAAEAAVRAAEESRKATAAGTETKTKHHDIQAALKAIRTADTKAQEEIRKLSSEGKAQLQRIIKEQKGQLEAYSRRTSEQGDVLLGDAQKLLVKANAMAASQLQAEERIRQEFDGFKDTILGLVSKTLGK
jgi:hypothetical protein